MANSSQKSPGGKGAATGTRAKKKAAPTTKARVKATAAKPTAAKSSAAKSTAAKAAAAKRAASKAALKAALASSEIETEDEDFATADAEASQSANGFGGGMHMGESENYLDFLSRVFQGMDANNWNTQQFDSMTQSMSLVLGSGPAFAALESMMANTTAQSAVLMNAVQTQRQLDQVGLCCTSACVKQLLNMNNNQDSD